MMSKAPQRTFHFSQVNVREQGQQLLRNVGKLSTPFIINMQACGKDIRRDVLFNALEVAALLIIVEDTPLKGHIRGTPFMYLYIGGNNYNVPLGCTGIMSTISWFFRNQKVSLS